MLLFCKVYEKNVSKIFYYYLLFLYSIYVIVYGVRISLSIEVHRYKKTLQ